jgi:multidrug efflux pump subunit AcrA (membrane-fusion protein)
MGEKTLGRREAANLGRSRLSGGSFLLETNPCVHGSRLKAGSSQDWLPHWSRSCLVIACALLLASCGKKAAEGEGGEEAAAATPVQVAPVTTGSIQRIVQADALLYPIHQASLTPKISAPVKQFFVNRGDHVKAGQLVATLENRDLIAAERESTANLEQAQAGFRTVSQATVAEDQTKAQSDVTASKSALEAAQKVYDSRVELLNQGAIARKLVDDAKVALVQAQTVYANATQHLKALDSVSRKEQILTAQAQVDAARARTQSAQAQVSYSELRSPINGVIADRSVFEGEMAPAGNALLTIIDISQVIAKANLPVTDATDVKVGMPATISFNGAELEGKVTVVSPAVDPNTTTVQVWVTANNLGEKLKPGAAVHMAIQAATLKDVTLVPTVALLNSDEGGSKVMTVDAKSIAHDRPVEVGVRQGDKTEILKGVSAGEQVIIVGGLGLDDKSKVKISTGKEEDEKDEKKGEDEKGK